MTDELIDIFNGDNKPLNMQKMKSEAHLKGFWHRSVHLWLYNKKGEILLQLRTPNKELHPGLWDISVGGHVSAGEEPMNSLVREAKEELGLQIKKKIRLHEIRKNNGKDRNLINNEFYYVYYLEFDGKLGDLILQDDEVSQVKFVDIAELIHALREHPNDYVPHGSYWYDAIEEIKRRTNYHYN
ncbi:NUDIX domain-containing protein [Candidatus Woesearchaeota archaeon]|nr:NUDIX domain-containing protein [Candidatus Woesearchaeota archaeon]